MKRAKMHLIYSILLSGLLILAGLCLMIACVGIYNMGDQPFSREAVATAFRRIRIPVWLSIGGILGGILLDLLLPEEKAMPRLQKPYHRILDNWQRRVDLSLCSPAVQAEIRRLENRRKIFSFISGLLFGIGATVFLVYSLNGDHFDGTDINGSMLRALWMLLGTMALPVAFGIFRGFAAVADLKREIDLLKNNPKSVHRAVPLARPVPTDCKALPLIRTVLLAAALLFLILGYCTGGTADVMTKAINICTECVGLG